VKEYFVDLHVHIGRDFRGRPVKVSGARDLTLENVAREAAERAKAEKERKEKERAGNVPSL